MRELRQPIGIIARQLGDGYYSRMLAGIHQVARKVGLPLIAIGQSLGDQPLPLFSADAVAGWIVLHPLEHDRAHLAALGATGTPLVMVPVPLEGSEGTVVHADNRSGMRAAVEHLIAHGHRRIVYADHGPHSWSQQRFLGYCDALEAHGIACDPALVLHTDSTATDGREQHIEYGRYAAQYLLEHDLGCTALAAPSDDCALAVMQTIQAAGRRVPEDLAVVGFDDIAEAQYASPPLTTVRCQFDALGRAAAEELLAEIYDGRGARSQRIAVPATVLQRRSCGCQTLDERLVTGAEDRAAARWQDRLLRQLVQVIRYPLPLDPAVPPEQIWPGASLLVASLDAALQGQLPAASGFELVWRQAIDQTENLELLNRALTLLEDAAEERLAPTSAEVGSAAQTLLREMRLELIRARVTYEVDLKQMHNEQVQTIHAVGMALLRSNGDAARSLAWLEHTSAAWGCLGLWDASPQPNAATLTVAGVYEPHGTPRLALGQHVRHSAFPGLDQLPRSDQQGQHLIVLCPIRTEERDWGVLALSGWDGQQLITSAASLTIQAALLGATLDRNAVLSALTEQQSTLQAAYSRERLLSQTIRELGCPIIPLLPGVLLVPLIGALDSLRAQQIISTVLEAITAQHAHAVLLDVTGVPIVDTQVANSLIQTAHAARLLGARVVMVGIRPEIAQSIVSLGIDLQHLTIESTLASAIRRLQTRK